MQKVWQYPNEFKLENWFLNNNNTFNKQQSQHLVSFGYVQRNCMGMHLAKRVWLLCFAWFTLYFHIFCCV